MVLTRVAERLDRTLVGFVPTAAEPTDDGYLYGYELELAAADGTVEHQRIFIEDTLQSGPRPGVLEIPIGKADAVVTAWIYPTDPELPALREVVTPAAAAGVLARLGHPVELHSIRVVSYRPGRRAVVRVEASPVPCYLKVVEPAKAAAIAERHQQFRSNGLPVPRLLGWSTDGVVAMSELPGVEAQLAVARIETPDDFLDQVDFLTALLAAVPAINTARASLLDRLDWYLDRLATRLPDEAARILAIGESIALCGVDGRSYGHNPVTIHGDLHLGQLFVDPENTQLITGMLDIDTAGVGDPADDAAAFYAHLVALGETSLALEPTYAAACARLATACRARWQRNRNAGFANRATAIAATHLLGHALRPVSVDPERVSRRLLDHAGSLVAGW